MVGNQVFGSVSEKPFGLEDACINLAKMAENLGDEATFTVIQCAWPTLSRTLLGRMLSYSEEPNPKSLEELMLEFRAAMTCS
jgi:hypothetical protein